MKTFLTHLHKCSTQWLRDERGALTLEFVMVIPLAMAVVIASVEASVITLRKTYLDRAVDMTVRELRLGKIANPSASAMKTKICARMGMVDDCTQNLTVELNVQQTAGTTGETINVPSLSAICIPRAENVEPVADPTFTPGVANELVLVRVCLVQDIVFPTSAGQLTKTHHFDIGGVENEQYELISTTAFVNEPR